MLSLLPTEPLGGDCLNLERTEPFTAVVEALLSAVVEALRNRDRLADREAAYALVDVALRDGRGEVRGEAVWTADRACMLSRSAPRRLPAGPRAVAVDEEAVVAMASLPGRPSTAAAAAADVLAALVPVAPPRPRRSWQAGSDDGRGRSTPRPGSCVRRTARARRRGRTRPSPPGASPPRPPSATP
ncbi:hypothetical protein [Streptomyces sp. NPDC096311]|uniref:hypothetical protein n=1 Tax=Streptomyces sp. NPDC096311 TaxID=3366083 RepID=UPI0037F13131